MIPGTGSLLLATAGSGGIAGSLVTLLAQAATEPAGIGIGDAIQGGGTVAAITAGVAFFRSTHAKVWARVDVLEQREATRAEGDTTYAREKARADTAEARAERLERKLDELNHTMVERVVPLLADTGRTLVDATTVLRARP